MRWEMRKAEPSVICDITNQAAPPSIKHFVRLWGNTNEITGVMKGDSIRSKSVFLIKAAH